MQYSNQQRARVINVEESDRLSFLPYLFGDDFMIAEMQVYALARKMITGYEGDFWHFIRLPDGGGYMMPYCDRVHRSIVKTGLIVPSAPTLPELF